MDAIAYQVNDLVTAMGQDAGTPVKSLRVDGGASANGYLMQTQADISNLDVIRPSCVETTALGAAYLAGLATVFWKDEDDIRKTAGDDTVFAPKIEEAERTVRIEGWKNAVKLQL